MRKLYAGRQATDEHRFIRVICGCVFRVGKGCDEDLLAAAVGQAVGRR